VKNRSNAPGSTRGLDDLSAAAWGPGSSPGHWVLTIVATLFLTTPATAQDCGTREGTCPTENGFYRLILPEGVAAPVPALVFLHGGSSTSAAVMKNGAMIRELGTRGYALITPEGQENPPRPRKNWGVFDNRTHPRDDIAFVKEAIADAARRGVDPGRVLLAGFSRGGSMVWDIACRAPGTARAYAPIAGAFWEPLPQSCAAPVDLFHSHGWTDRIVPIEGRSFRNGRVVQGDLFAGLAVLRRTNGCEPQMPDDRVIDHEAGLWFRRWTGCAGGRLDLLLHPGGHGTPKGWLTRVLDWFEARLAK